MITTEGERAQVVSEPSAVAEERAHVIIRDPLRFMSLVVAGATAASMAGIGGLVLAIFGLCGVLSAYFAPVDCIVAGLAFLVLGAVSAAWGRMFHFSEHETARDRIAVSSGVILALAAGVAAVALGILNLVFLSTVQFGSIAVIALGLGLLWHSGVMRRVSRFTNYMIYHGIEGRRPTGPMAINALSLAPLRDFLLGLGSVILGILALVGFVPLVLGLVALLVISGALTLTVSTICGATLTTLKGVCWKS